LASQRADIEFIGAVDIDEQFIGRDLGEVAGIEHKLGITVSKDLEAILSQTNPHFAFLTTSSSLRAVCPQVEKFLLAGINVISTCEELSYPYRKDPILAVKIDKIAKANNARVLSTGVNPGFLMDAWPLFMTGVCQQIDRIRSVRVQDASRRRGPFQRKIGAALAVEEFKALVDAGMIKHVGLPESVAMIASGLGWEINEITERIEPIISETQIKTEFLLVKPGYTAGIRQIAKGIRSGVELITLEFEASVGSHESYDAVYITGIPNMEVIIRGGVHGDIATAAIIVNSVYRVAEAPPGLLTMKDLPIVSATGSLH
jgi:4-hydroxy-tetrahydrodipicolinate reductase